MLLNPFGVWNILVFRDKWFNRACFFFLKKASLTHRHLLFSANIFNVKFIDSKNYNVDYCVALTANVLLPQVCFFLLLLARSYPVFSRFSPDSKASNAIDDLILSTICFLSHNKLRQIEVHHLWMFQNSFPWKTHFTTQMNWTKYKPKVVLKETTRIN